ncbi:class I SAM-dependent methyltransferase [Bacillus carboniphilus]|uniref:Class I SAM-dependent methyltransferase n=1 Tax=Bacillus carboniphilus TaxID=86663 RepID=A0ABY9K0A8_9BACI|nr:class I SAM-dependent methyltransferase [Bacillus carboniphilus]WLR43336.1 class I SAM-dependent methyltransferase [Bacillus carboniphilus]
MSNDYINMLANLAVHSAHPGGIALTKYAIEQVPLSIADKILDIGCGTGASSILLSNLGMEVVGVDHHPKMIEKANLLKKQQDSDATFLCEDITNLSFQDESFDCLLIESVLTFTPLKSSLNELSRVLKPKGWLIAIELTVKQTLTKDEKDELVAFYGFNEFYRNEEWVTLLKNSGYEVLVNENGEEIELSFEDAFSDVELGIGDSHSYETLNKHLLLTDKFQSKLGYRLFICQK